MAGASPRRLRTCSPTITVPVCLVHRRKHRHRWDSSKTPGAGISRRLPDNAGFGRRAARRKWELSLPIRATLAALPSHDFANTLGNDLHDFRSARSLVSGVARSRWDTRETSCNIDARRLTEQTEFELTHPCPSDNSTSDAQPCVRIRHCLATADLYPAPGVFEESHLCRCFRLWTEADRDCDGRRACRKRRGLRRPMISGRLDS